MSWDFVVADTSGTHLGDLIGAKSRSLSFPIDAPATAKWTSRGDDPGALLTVELATDLMAYRDGTLMFRGRTGATGDDLDANSHKVDWSAVGYRGMLARRVIWPSSTKTFTGVDQATIAWTLIDDTQALPDGNLGITNGSSATGTLRDRTYEAGKPIGEALDELSQVIGGFDWDISPALEFQLFYPQRGSTVGWAAVFGDTISKVKRGVDPATFATDLYGTGGDTTTPITRSATSRGPAGRWESTVSWSDVTVQGTLVEHTEAELAQAEDLAPSYQLTVAPGTWTPADAWLGDTVRFVCRKGRLNIDTTGRIVQVDIAVDDDGEETAVLTLDRRPVTLTDRFLSTQDRLATLSRR